MLWVIADYRCDFQQIDRKSRLVVFRARQPLYVEACEGPGAAYRRAAVLRERLEAGLPLVPHHGDEQVGDSTPVDGDPAVTANGRREGSKEPFEAAVVLTDLAGFILDANAAAARLLNIGQHSIRPRRFLWFFLHARDAILAAQRAAAMGETCTVATMLRPADRRSVVVSLIVTRMEDELRWTVLR
jgi:PAS domain-containing protein